MSPCEHFVQIYEADDTFLEILSAFVGGGLLSGDAAIVIAIPSHMRELERRLTVIGVDVAAHLRDGQYVPLDAEQTLSKFMVNGWPDEVLFAQTIGQIVETARGPERRKIRAFGEMVALLWAKGQSGATVRLEHLWHRLCHEEHFSLFCAYPKVGLTEAPADAIADILSAHSRVFVE
jgi:DcmR-like sensory protein